jgi:hypothetical protein
MTDDQTEEQISSPEAHRVETQPSNFVSDPDALAKMLDMELALKRQQWQQRRSQRGTWRALSILFVILVIAGALAAYFFFAMNYRQRAEPSPTIEAKDSTR